MQKLHDQLTAFRRAANSIALEAKVISVQVDHTQAANSVTGDQYFLQLIAEAELRLKAVTARCERLQKAAIKFVDLGNVIAGAMADQKADVKATELLTSQVAELREALAFDLSGPLDYTEVDTSV